MSKPKTKSRAQAEVGTETLGIASTFKQAEERLDRPKTWIRRACDEGGAKTNGGRIDMDKAKAWIDANEVMLSEMKEELPLREQKIWEEVRRIRNFNDREDGKLIERAWVRERFHRYGGELAAIRAKAEAEDPVRFAEAGLDIALIRSEYRKTWDAIMIAVQNAAEHFAE